MKKLVLLVLAFALMAVMFGCASEEGETTPETQNKPTESTGVTTYPVTIKDAAWLTEELEDSYPAGETVTVKVRLMDNAKITLLVNGDEITQSEETDTYIQFVFTMPAEAVALEVRSEDASDSGDWGELH